MPKISVIIPAYNSEQTIRETITSVLNQTFTDFELIVINDGSTDNTLSLLQNISDNRLKIHSYENGGLATARNRGITRASGEFLSFLDADDLWTPDKLASQLAVLEQHPEAGAAYSWTVCMMQEETSVLFVEAHANLVEGNIYEDLLLENFIGSGSNILVRRSVINTVGQFKDTFKTCEDWDFYLRVAAKFPFVVVPKNQIIYRKAIGSMSSQPHRFEESGLRLLENAYQTAPRELQHLQKQSHAALYVYIADLYLTHHLDKIGVRQAQKRLRLAIAHYPKVLFEKRTHRLILKSLLRTILPIKFTKLITQFFKKPFTTRDPRLQI
jgi:glycosyltransferase involved in cell wall biosynthesis